LTGPENSSLFLFFPYLVDSDEFSEGIAAIAHLSILCYFTTTPFLSNIYTIIARQNGKIPVTSIFGLLAHYLHSK
jgi:hypothetical protein